MFERVSSLTFMACLVCAIGAAPNSLWAQAATEEPVFLTIAIPVRDLPVWSVDESGTAHFDASILISHIKSNVEPDSWKNSAAGIGQNSSDSILFVTQTPEIVNQVSHFIRRQQAFANHYVEKRLKDNLETAAASSQRVLLFVSDGSSDSTNDFFDAWLGNRGTPELEASLRNYVVQCMTPSQAAAMPDHKIGSASGLTARLAVLHSDGSLVTEANFAEFQPNGEFDAELLSTFLEKHSEQLPDAKAALQSALDQADREGKRVLLQMGGPNCGPCIILSRFLDSQSDLISRDYVYVKLDNRMPRADQLTAELVDGLKLVPWMTILSSKGEVLATSVSNEGNIAFPRTQAARLHFEKMLETTSRRLTDSEIEMLAGALEKWR